MSAPAPTVQLRTSPLTGLPESDPKPVLVVKYDNTHNAQPQAGLDQADIVYVEPVEYGLTRIAAVFSASIPRRIGPIRSARISDIDLLAGFGTPAFAYSGAQHKMFPVLDAAAIYDVSPRHGGIGYARDQTRPAPYNLFLDGTVALARAPQASVDHDMGFAFSANPPAGGLPNTRVKMHWSYAKAAFIWNPATGRYTVQMNGYPDIAQDTGKSQQASTVIIQYVQQENSPFHDKFGGITPLAHTVGIGRGVVLRDGMAYDVRWSRPSPTSGTIFTMTNGQQMPFKPGQQWIVLLDKSRPAHFTPALPTGAGTSASASSALTTNISGE